MVIDHDGNVGIGTTSPAQLLHVKANNPGGKIRLEMGQAGVANTDVTGEIQFYHNDASVGPGGGFCGPGAGLGGPGGGFSDSRSSGKPLLLLRLKKPPPGPPKPAPGPQKPPPGPPKMRS